MAGGQLKYLEGQGKVVEVSAKPTSQLSSITTKRCWQLSALEMQSNHQSDPLQETPETGKLCTSNSHGQIYEGYLPLSWRKLSPSKDSMWQSSMGIRIEILNWSRLYSPTSNDYRHFCCHNLKEGGATAF